MALVVSRKSSSSSSSSLRAEKKPWMLKDYLGDDLSSCSSNGFRSFPRRQCCVAARNIIESEVITRNCRRRNTTTTKPPKRMIVKYDCSFSSALQRASMAVVNAVKLIPFNSAPAKNDDGKRFLPRSLSKKLFRRSFFWKKERSTSYINNNNVVRKKKRSKNDHHNNNKKKQEEYIDEIERWISSGAVGKDKYQPLDLSNGTTVTNVSSASNSNSDGKSTDDSSWSDITFTSDSHTSFSENDDVERRKKEVIRRGAEEDSVEPAVHDQENMWVNEEAGKEHTSPISVLDFPDDDEGGSSSPFTLRVSRIKGTKERLMKKLGRFECLVGLEPVNLESLLSSPDLDHRSPECSIQPCSTPSFILSACVSEEEEEEEEEEEDAQGEEREVSHESQAEKHAQYLLSVTKANVTTPSTTTHNFELQNNVLLDYFRENITQKESHALLKAAEDWLNGHYDNLILGWEVKDKRQAYIRDMEEGGWWPRDTKLQREEVAVELGDEVMTHLIDELTVEFCSSS